MTNLHRRDFFCALAASAAVAGVLPVGWPKETREYVDFYDTWYDSAEPWFMRSRVDTGEIVEYQRLEFFPFVSMPPPRPKWVVKQVRLPA